MCVLVPLMWFCSFRYIMLVYHVFYLSCDLCIASIPTLSIPTSLILNSHLVNVDKVGINEVGVDEMGS